MKPSVISFKKLLLLTSMVFAPSLALAQQPSAAQEPTPQADTGEVVVLGRFIPQPMRETSEVAAFLSAEDLSRQGDDTAAVALTRLTGLSVVSNRFVFVRGLGDRYSSALLNGSPLPSPEPLRRTVPLDLFPSNILDGAAVQKTFSPNYPGDFGGGIISLQTVGVANDPFLTLKASGGATVETTGTKGYVYFGEDGDWTSFAGDDRKAPGPIVAAVDRNLAFNNQNFTDAELETAGESLVNSPFTVVQKQQMPANVELEATAGTSFERGVFTIGLLGVAGYDSSFSIREATFGETGFSRDFGNRDSTTWGVTVNGMGGLSVGWDENEIKATALYVHDTSKEAEVFTSTDENGIQRRRESTGWYERELAWAQLAGEHEAGPVGFDWRTAWARSRRDAPYNRYVQHQIDPVTGVPFYTGASGQNRTSFSDLTDELASGGADLSYTLPLSEQRNAVFSVGVDYNHTVRVFDSLDLEYRLLGGTLPADVATARVDYLFSPDNIASNRFQIFVPSTSNVAYKGDLLVQSAYLASDVEIIPLVRTALGVRFEEGSQSVRTSSRFGTAAAPPTGIENSYWLPAATLTWNFMEDTQLRVGYSQTIARPQFRELGASIYNDPETDRDYRGNPLLIDTELKNYDARIEHYMGPNRFVTGGVFYKSLENPIEELISPTGGRDQTSFYNAPEAILYGAELEFRSTFPTPYLTGGFWDEADWLFAINYTYTTSEVKVEPGDMVVDPASLALTRATNLVQDGSQLQGLSPHILNVQFGFETDNSQLTFLAGWVDERILERNGTLINGQYVDLSVFEVPGWNLDLVYRRDLTIAGQDMTLGLSGRNLLATQHDEYRLTTAGMKEDVNVYDRGQSFSISLTAKF